MGVSIVFCSVDLFSPSKKFPKLHLQNAKLPIYLGQSLILQEIVWVDDTAHIPPYFLSTDFDLNLV